MAPHKFTNGTIVSLALMIAVCTINLVEFIFVGHHAYDFISAIGVALMVYGTYKIGSWTIAIGNGNAQGNRVAQYSRGIGMLLFASSLVIMQIR